VVYTGIPRYAICEIAADEAIFDLTSVDVVDNPGDFDISYYLSSDDARLPQDPIDVNDLDAYTSANTTIYVRVEDPNNGCYDVASFELIVNPLPELLTDQVELSECDDGTGNAEFDLEEANDLLMVDTAGFIFTFYNDPNDAITGDDPIDSSALYTGFEGEEIHVRIASDESCYSYATLTLNVVEAPEIDP